MTREHWAALVLRVPAGASQAQISEAYRLLVQVWHPDRHGANENVRIKAEVEIKKINLAYSILTGKDGEAEVPSDWMSDYGQQQSTSSQTWQREERRYEEPEPPRQATWTATYNEQPPAHRQERDQSGAGAFGGLIIGGLIGLFIGGWGAIPGALIGAFIGGAIGGTDRGAGEALDETGGCALGCIGETLSQIIGCGCLILIVAVIIFVVSGG